MKTKLFFLLICMFCVNAYSQTVAERQEIIANYDLEKLSQLEEEYAIKFAANKQKALEFAARYGWELFIDLPNGGKAELVGVSESGKPEYFATCNREGGITTRTDRVHTGGSTGLDLNGENMILGIWDAGTVSNTHPLLENRVTQIDCPNCGHHDHATHVAGTMIGTGNVIGGAAKGMAPVAELLAYNWADYSAEMVAAAASGLLISNHSWGEWDFTLWKYGYYDNYALEIDEIIYNAPYHLSIRAAGNLRQSGTNSGDGGYDYLTSFAVAKNNIVVANVFEVLNYTGANSVIMSASSGWGPTDDGRIKPDISAKGINMYSSVGTNAYENKSGTSMATPNVSGSLILLQQHYNNQMGEYMLASTLRGLALHTADEAGSDPGPDYRFGWGLLNIERAADVISENDTSTIIIEEELHNSEVYTFSVQSNGIDDLMASITWTDLPGVILPGGPENEDDDTPSLINDLDLRVSQDGGATYYPWKLDPTNFSAAATSGDNFVDNIEKIEAVGALGEYIIQVSHKGGALTNDSQVFSLIVTGIDREEYYVSSHEGIKEACTTDSSATFDINLGFSDGFSDTINFSVSNLPGGTTGSISPPSMNSEGTTVLTVNDIGSLTPGDYPITVTATGSSETVNVYMIFRILPTDVPMVGLIYPADEAIDLPVVIEFMWELGDGTVNNYDFELSRYSDFSDIEFSENVLMPHVLILGVTEGAEYFWRVKPNTICADGEFSEAFSFTVEGVLDVNEYDIEGLVVYPNPTTNMLNVEAATIISSIEVFNILGQTLYSETKNTNKIQIDFSSAKSGIYFLKVKDENGNIASKKIVKE